MRVGLRASIKQNKHYEAAMDDKDLVRLHAFLHQVNSSAAIQIVKQLVAGAEQLLTYPQLGEHLIEFSPRNVR